MQICIHIHTFINSLLSYEENLKIPRIKNFANHAELRIKKGQFLTRIFKMAFHYPYGYENRQEIGMGVVEYWRAGFNSIQ